GASGTGPGGAPFTGTVTATSVFDPTKSDNGTISLGAITASTVDLTNNPATGNPGDVGPGPAATPARTVTANPGTLALFPLTVRNTSGIPDTYVLTLSSTTPLPAGATITFRSATTGQVITNTGSIPAGGTVNVVAEVTLPANATPSQSTDLIFVVTSPTTGATDSLRDRLNIATVRDLDIVPPSQNSQAFPGNFALYTHTITNKGNVVEGDGAASTVNLTATNNASGFTSVIYWDANGNGTLDATDPAITSLSQVSAPAGAGGTVNTADRGLDPGETVTIFVKTFAPANATLGTTNVTTITATTVNGTNTGTPPTDSATDTTTVIASNIQLTKAQALDATCNGTPDTGSYTQANITTGARPGACIRYRILVTNIGTAPALSVVVNDSIPSFTLYNTGDGVTGATGVAAWAPSNAAGTPIGAFTAAATAPAANGTGALSWNIGTLNPGQSAVIFFGVRIQP
ncbi:MAG: hypothetical protein M3347_05255, partial [Armatimonadota bacterium]|nr:hypothetical protein [Armatimonadota bacterium]